MAIDDADGAESDAGLESDAGAVTASAEEGEDAAAETEPEVPVTVGEYGWEEFKREFYYDEEGNPPRDGEGNVVEFDPSEYLGFDPKITENVLAGHEELGERLGEVVDERTVDVNPDLDEDAFFSSVDGATTVANRYDLEKSVPLEKKHHFREEDRYWVNKPYAFVVIFHSEKENEKKYYLIEPYLTAVEADLREFLAGKLKTAIKYSSDEVVVEGEDDERAGVIEREIHRLLDRYDLYAEGVKPVRPAGVGAVSENGNGNGDGGSVMDQLRRSLGMEVAVGDGEDAVDEGDGEGATATDDIEPVDGSARAVGASGNGNASGGSGVLGQLRRSLGMGGPEPTAGGRRTDAMARPEPVLLEEDAQTLTGYQIEKLLYLLKRDFIGFERIDGIKHDINIEDISCDGYNSPVFVYHGDYEQIISNVYHGKEELDDFVVKMAQRSGKGISKRQPQVDATLPDGSRSQLTLGKEVSDHGTNYTIRQFKDVPFTPIDLINWNTFSLDEMAFLWLCIENHKSLIFAGGTASGKTTSLNAVSLFIPSKAKIVSIEDTREVELPQRNWIASVTRPSFSEGDKGDVDEFDLLEAALRQRPEYIVMGEIRGEEGRTLFQVMSTGHTTLTTFHADSVGEVIKRFTTDPINVSKTMFTALDLVSIQTSTRVQGTKVRRNKSLTEINHYDPENDEINVQDVYQWQAETDEFLQMGESNTLEEIMFDRGWGIDEINTEMFKRKLVLAYLIDHGLNTYTQVAATLQAFINDPETILTLIADGDLERSLEDLREMESVSIDIDPEKEEMVPRPEPTEEGLEEARGILEDAEDLLGSYRGRDAADVADALEGGSSDGTDSFDFGGFAFEEGDGE
ncbi:MAG: type II/IV secretion system ATPase subunit [Haloarculaceae archaeon]